MSMDSKLSSILQDLYRLDPTLREREEELIPVLEALLRAKPNVAFDAKFAATLRKQLLTPSQTPSRTVSMAPSLFNKFAFAGMGGLIALVIAVPLTYELTQSGASFEEFSLAEVSSVPTITNLSDDAFGTISPTSEAPLGSLETRSSVAYGMGGSPSALQAPVADGDAASSNGDEKVSELTIAPGEPYPGVIEYAYTYTGEALDLSQISDAVYRKNGGLNIGNLGNDILRAKLGPVDFGAFRGLEMQSFSVKQSDKNGYSIYVDPTYGMISINGNEGIWAYNGEYVPFTEEQVMSDEDLIATANKFLSDYAIDTTGFGSPVVDDRGLIYARSMPADSRYIPEAMTVTYPLMLEGQPTFNSDGSPYGLQVMINMRTETVASVNINLASSYDKSSYALERDSAAILALAEKGGLYSYDYEGETETINIELGTPEIILINHYSYNGTESENLFIPALSFPVTKNSETNPLYTDSVVIPLVKSVIDQAAQQPVYPLMERAQ